MNIFTNENRVLSGENMRWTEPNDGDIKIKRKFALFPVCINDEHRWLEWVTIKYEYCIRRPYRNYLTGELVLFTGWLAIEFVDDYERDMELIE